MDDQLPDDLPVEHRNAVRLVVLDERGHVLLFHTRNPDYPELGTWWELPGGGIDTGESYLDAAVRELREETGFAVEPHQVGAPSWRRQASYKFQRVRRVQDEVVVTVQLDGIGPAVDTSAQLDYELDAYLAAHWWPVADVLGARERFYPGRLPALLPALLAGEHIDEPFELWS